MFPLRDDIPARNFPFVNIGLIVFNTAVFLFQLGLGPDFERFIVSFGFVPVRFMTQQAENWLDLTRFLPVLTSIFMHGSLFHLIANMWMLWIFGDNVEDCMGHGRYLVFFLLCGITSVFAQGLSAPASQVPMVGASGSISGVLGAYFLTYPRARILTLVPIFILFYLIELPAFFFLGLWFVMQFINGYYHLLSVGSSAKGGVAWWAHIGGFGAGALLLGFFRKKGWRTTYRPSSQRVRRLKR